MTPSATQHPLTTDQLDALLHNPGQANPSPELAGLRSVLSDFRATSISAADHHHRYASITPARSRTHRAFWAFATAALIFGAATPLAFHHHPANIAPVATTTRQPAPSISDEVLYADVQADLNASVPSPMLPLTANSSTGKSTTAKDSQ